MRGRLSTFAAFRAVPQPLLDHRDVHIDPTLP
jgi:hypothetical protein